MNGLRRHRAPRSRAVRAHPRRNRRPVEAPPPFPVAPSVERGPTGARRKGPPVWALRLMRKRTMRRFATLLFALVGVGLIVLVSGARFARQEVGYVGVVRNGGPLDSRTIRQILQPGQSLTWVGLFSESPHKYPASNVNRTYTVTADSKRGNRLGVDVVTVPTEDGVQVGVEATVFVRFVGEKDPGVLTRFDVSYGSRRFPTPSGRLLYPWQGDTGFYAWMDTLFRPVLDYNLRKEVGLFQCAQLVASCALVSRGATNRRVALADSESIARRISAALEKDLTRTFGAPYLWDIRMRIARITLPKGVQAAVDDVQAKYAAVNASEAELKAAKYIAERNRLLGAAYNKSPALATIEAMRAIPKGSTVFLNTNSGKQPSILVGGNK
jgi:regulator of protease activity HflC (stomatin/prohibitin superfamily)